MGRATFDMDIYKNKEDLFFTVQWRTNPPYLYNGEGWLNLHTLLTITMITSLTECSPPLYFAVLSSSTKLIYKQEVYFVFNKTFNTFFLISLFNNCLTICLHSEVSKRGRKNFSFLFLLLNNIINRSPCFCL